MTDRELMQQALDALLRVWHSERNTKHSEAIEALRARLAQPEPKVYSDIDEMFRDIGVQVTEQEPVAWGIANTRPTEKNPLMMVMLDEPEPSHLVVPLYTAPPQREWQGLTDEEQSQVAWSCGAMSADWLEFARAIEAKLKEKNI